MALAGEAEFIQCTCRGFQAQPTRGMSPEYAGTPDELDGYYTSLFKVCLSVLTISQLMQPSWFRSQLTVARLMSRRPGNSTAMSSV